MIVAQSVEKSRSQRIFNVSNEHKSIYGQYLTPDSIAIYMSNLLLDYSNNSKNAKILDPGAGQGILSITLIELIKSKRQNTEISLDAYEIDDSILAELNHNLQKIENLLGIEYKIINHNFIDITTQEIGWNINTKYSYIIMNPPYKKLNVSSSDYKHLQELGIETTNYYSAFVGISILLLKENGLVAAILPRSFCNGKYFLSFRKLILKETKILHIHTFKSRTESFKEEGVLQENVILVLRKTHEAVPFVNISSSSDRQFSDYINTQQSLADIVDFSDPELYFHIPNEEPTEKNIITTTLLELDIKISTGPVVDFRMKEALRQLQDKDSIPLLYSVHLKNGGVVWPVVSKKPNAIVLTLDERRKIAFPSGYYVVVKRFSSKEEKRRIWPALITPESFTSSLFTVENHINIFHINKHGLEKEIAIGLFVFLSTQYIDMEFRKFSGHTQVNATDLKQLKYPTQAQLIEMTKLYEMNRYSFDEIFELVV